MGEGLRCRAELACLALPRFGLRCLADRLDTTRPLIGAQCLRTEIAHEPPSGSGTGSIRAPCTPIREVRARGRHARYVDGHQDAPLNVSARLKYEKQLVLRRFSLTRLVSLMRGMGGINHDLR